MYHFISTVHLRSITPATIGCPIGTLEFQLAEDNRERVTLMKGEDVRRGLFNSRFCSAL